MQAAVRKFLPMLAIGVLVPSLVLGDSADDPDENEPQDFRRKTPSSQYVDPSSFFRLHGYVTLMLSEAGHELGAGSATPPILVGGLSPRTGENVSGFSNDAAIFVGGEPFDGVGTVIELHLIGSALDPVLTEAKITWDFVDGESSGYGMRLVGGRYWWPFGVHNEEWFSALNRFGLASPAAAEVVPAHYNELGLMIEGEGALTPGSGVNYSFSVGNGVSSFELEDNVGSTEFDQNGGRTLTGSAEYVLRRKQTVSFGFSGSLGELRAGLDEDIPTIDPRRFAADFSAWGIHATVDGDEGVRLRAYYYASRENFIDARLDRLERSGVTLEPEYRFRFERTSLRYVSVFARYSEADEEAVSSAVFRRIQYGAGLEAAVKRNLRMRFAYLKQDERNGARVLDNDLLTYALVAEF